MNRQERRKQERLQAKLQQKSDAFRKVSPLAEEVHRQGYEQGWHDACQYCMRTCYAGAVLALHDLEGYGKIRNARFLRLMDGYITNTLTSEEIMEDALQKAGVYINFREPFPEERIQEVVK